MSYTSELLQKSFESTWSLFVSTPLVTLFLFAISWLLSLWWSNRSEWRVAVMKETKKWLLSLRGPFVVACLVFGYFLFFATPKQMWTEKTTEVGDLKKRVEGATANTMTLWFSIHNQGSNQIAFNPIVTCELKEEIHGTSTFYGQKYHRMSPEQMTQTPYAVTNGELRKYRISFAEDIKDVWQRGAANATITIFTASGESRIAVMPLNQVDFSPTNVVLKF